MANDVYTIVKQAIIDKQQIVATYNGYTREMCPHTIGTKRGRTKALFYQFGGGSSSGLSPAGSPDNWRCVFLDNLQDVSARPGDWYTSEQHTQRQTCIDEVDVEVAAQRPADPTN
jgi:hypothetical protein